MPVPLLPAEQAWIVALSDLPAAGGALDEQRVYIPLRNGELVALDRETGKARWSQSIQATFQPTVHDSRLYVPSSGSITALDALTGVEQWTTPLDAPPATVITWDDGSLFAVLNGGVIAAFNAATGQRLWQQELGDQARHRAIAGGNAGGVYVSRVDSQIVALNRKDGSRLWTRRLTGTLSEPAVTRDRVFVGSNDNFFYALNAKSGAIEWKWRSGGDVIGAAADEDGNVFFASLDNILRAVKRGSGNQRWKEEIPTRPALPPWTFGHIVVLSGVSEITAFSSKDGKQIGSYTAPAELEGPPLLDPLLKPYRVSFVAVTRDGRAFGLRSSGMMFPEPMLNPLQPLPGRRLERERLVE